MYRSGKDKSALKTPRGQPPSVAELVWAVREVPQVTEYKRSEHLMCKEGRILILLVEEKRGGP